MDSMVTGRVTQTRGRWYIMPWPRPNFTLRANLMLLTRTPRPPVAERGLEERADVGRAITGRRAHPYR